MYKYIMFFLCIRSGGVLCQEEGADCEWEGLKGTCVKETRCMTTLDDNSPEHPICSTQDGHVIICCTDCQLVNNTEFAVISPTSGIYWKNGQKARDSCLQYLKDLPYQCKLDGFYSWIRRKLDETEQCYNYDELTLGDPSSSQRNNDHPHNVLLGYGDSVLRAEWPLLGGFIISDQYIVTAAQSTQKFLGNLKFVALGVTNRSTSPETWQVRKIKRVILHPEYNATDSRYPNIALIETDSPIEFNENILPVCLHVEEDAAVDDAIATTWFNLQNPGSNPLADTLQTVQLQKINDEECKTTHSPSNQLNRGYDQTTQICYGNKIDAIDYCWRSTTGEPLLVNTQFSSCVYTAIGVVFFCTTGKSTAFTRISSYLPWIESIVWP